MEENSIFESLNRRIDKFDLCALFKALDVYGVDLEKLLFVGTQNPISHSHICKAIEPQNNSIVSAIVKLNLGLLTPTSPLPSYYQRAIEKGEIDEEEFISFIQFFNHHVIKTILKFTWVEKFFIPDWSAVKRESLSMLGLDSVSSIHWLFSLYFPELELSVDKCVKEQRMTSAEFCLGISKLGEKYALGGYVRRKIRAYTVALRSDTAQTETRKFWPAEIRKRLKDRIFPHLNKTHIYLIVTFTIDQYKRATYLNPHSYLGFTSLGETTSNFTWSLFEGYSR